jgi:hypothetical protein
VPKALWDYRLGGYQILKKWLSYREHDVLKRGLKAEEVAHFRNTARRIATLLLMGPTLDENYRMCSTETYSVTAPVHQAESGEAAPAEDTP